MKNLVFGLKVSINIAFSVQKSSLIIMEKILACSLPALNIIDKLLRDFNVSNTKEIGFDGKTVFCCEFRQILTVT